MKHSHSYQFAKTLEYDLSKSADELTNIRFRLNWAIDELDSDGDVGMHIPTLKNQVGTINLLLNSILQDRAKWSAYAKARFDNEQRNQQFQ